MSKREWLTAGSIGPACEQLVHSRRGFLRRAAKLTACGAVIGGSYAVWSSQLEVTRHSSELGLPRPVRVAAISDLHLVGDAEDYAELLERIRSQRPDLLVVVGDTVDPRNGAATYELIEILGEISTPLGKIATLGNWDYDAYDDLSTFERALERVDVRLLVNDVADVGALRLVGLDDDVRGRPELDVAASALEDSSALVLSHCPRVFDRLLDRIVDSRVSRPFMMLSGHTHGGQVAPLGLATWRPPGSGRFLAGWYREAAGSLYVMRGIGYSGPRVRVGSTPELTIVDIV